MSVGDTSPASRGPVITSIVVSFSAGLAVVTTTRFFALNVPVFVPRSYSAFSFSTPNVAVVFRHPALPPLHLFVFAPAPAPHPHLRLPLSTRAWRASVASLSWSTSPLWPGSPTFNLSSPLPSTQHSCRPRPSQCSSPMGHSLDPLASSPPPLS